MWGATRGGTGKTLVFLSIAAGCGPQPDYQPGELGNGVFYWLCSSLADPSCVDMDTAAQRFPGVTALGGDFMLQFQSNSGRYLAPHSGSVHLAEGSPTGTFTAMLPGYASVVVYEGDTLLDYLHIEVQPVMQLQMSSTGIGEGLEVGDSATVQVTALCADGPCAGALPYQWGVDNPALLMINSPAVPDDQVSISALAPGSANVLVSAGANAGGLSVNILGELPQTGDTGIEETGTGPDDTGTTDGTTDTVTTDTGTTTSDTGVL